MKKCRFCAEEIQDEAVKCRYCNEFLDESCKPKLQGKWYYSTLAVVVGLATLGPLGLPLVWKNPKYNMATKVTITIVLAGVTVWLCYLMGKMYQGLIEQVTSLGLS